MKKDYSIKLEYITGRINNIIDVNPKLVAYNDDMGNSQESPYYLRYDSDTYSLWSGTNTSQTNKKYLTHLKLLVKLS